MKNMTQYDNRQSQIQLLKHKPEYDAQAEAEQKPAKAIAEAKLAALGLTTDDLKSTRTRR
jgi:hypothetical protein